MKKESLFFLIFFILLFVLGWSSPVVQRERGALRQSQVQKNMNPKELEMNSSRALGSEDGKLPQQMSQGFDDRIEKKNEAAIVESNELIIEPIENSN